MQVTKKPYMVICFSTVASLREDEELNKYG